MKKIYEIYDNSTGLSIMKNRLMPDVILTEMSVTLGAKRKDISHELIQKK